MYTNTILIIRDDEILINLVYKDYYRVLAPKSNHSHDCSSPLFSISEIEFIVCNIDLTMEDR